MHNLNLHHVTNIQVSGITTYVIKDGLEFKESLADKEDNEFSSWREIKFTCMTEGKEETFTVSVFSNISSNIYRTKDALAVAISKKGTTIKEGDK
jgi:hypothetical protein